MNVIQIFLLNFIFLKTFAIHEIEFYSINCSTSTLKSIEVGNCECDRNKVTVELNYVRVIEQHYVKNIKLKT
jgi:hypothetical protein